MDASEAPRRSSSLVRPDQSLDPNHQNQPGELVSLPATVHSTDTARGREATVQPSRSNRFSLTFPILPASKETSPTRPAISPDVLGHETITGSAEWLTAIAAQERRVLEIKEELLRAETELNKLKLQWTTYEAQNKRNEAKRTTKLRPVSTILPATGNDDVTGSNAWLQHEMERRKTLMSSARNSSRRVFSGSKHTRTLSLLSPVDTAQTMAPPSHRPRGATSPVKSKARDGLPMQHLPRAATTPDLGADDGVDKIDLAAIDKDMLLKTGKKMASDLRDGIWTFWEDLRQATVGEDMVEVLPPAHLRHQSSGQTLRTPRRGGSKSSLRGSSRGSTSRAINPSTKESKSPRASPSNLPLFEGSGVEEATPPQHTALATKRSSKHVKAPSVAISVASSDAFDAWDDSPKASGASSATSDSTSQGGSKETSPKVDISTRNPIPWPNIASLGPGTLRRTASHLMSEWDKLSPPLREESNDYVHMKAESSAHVALAAEHTPRRHSDYLPLKALVVETHISKVASDTESSHSTPLLASTSTPLQIPKTSIDAHFALDAATASPPPFSYGAPPPLYLVSDAALNSALPTAHPESSAEATAATSSSIAGETKAALPRDTKDGPAGKDLDDGEPPPPYTEGSSPVNGLQYVMAAAGSIITQVQQGGPAPINTAIGGASGDENLTLDLRGTRFTLSRDELLTLPEFVLLSLFPNGLLPDSHMNSFHDGDVYSVDVRRHSTPVAQVSRAVASFGDIERVMLNDDVYLSDMIYLSQYDPTSLQYMLEFFRDVAQTIPQASAESTSLDSAAMPIEPMAGNARDMLQDRAGIIVLREDLDFYAIPPKKDIEQHEMLEVKRAAGKALLKQNGIFSGLRKSEEPGTTEQHLIEMLTAGGFDHADTWGHRAPEPNKAVICSIALARLRTDIRGETANSNAVGMAQKLLLFWRKPARRCWWEGVELDNVEGVEGPLKVWIRRVWTLEMSVIGLR